MIVFIFLLLSCKKDKVKTLTVDYGYFPLETGQWIIYNIESVTIDTEINLFDTTIYQLKETVESIYLDTTGEEVARIERYTRENDTLPWVISDVWTAKRTGSSAQKTEENIKYIKMIFPAEKGKTWNGNAYNHLDSQEYEITNTDHSASYNNLIFDSVMTITHAYDSSLIDKNHIYERYAKNTGLIYKYAIDVYSNIQNFNPALPIEERISSGSIYKQEIIDYGN